MSKHLRFGRLLGLLAIMLTMSFAWAQGQNLSSEKVLSHFKLTAAENSLLLFGDVVGTVDQDTKVVTIEFPYRYKTCQPDEFSSSATMTASFKSSNFSNVFYGQATPTDLMIGSAWRTSTSHVMGQGFGTEPTAPWILSENAFPFADGDVITVEAENHSYLFYTLEVTYGAPSAMNNLLTLQAAFEKPLSAVCTPVSQFGDGVVTMTGTAIKVDVPYGTILNPIGLTFTTDPFSKVTLSVGGAVLDPAIPTVPNVYVITNADLSAPFKIYVYPQAYCASNTSVTYKTYTVTAVVGVPSEQDEMMQLVFTAAANPELESDVVGTLDPATQTWTVVVPFGVDINALEPSWEISPYATMFNLNPQVPSEPAVEICSATDLGSAWFHRPIDWYRVYKGICWLVQWWHPELTCEEILAPMSMIEHDGTLGDLFTTAGGLTNGCGSFWVRAEDPSEVSEYPFCITNAPCSTANTLTAISATYSKANTCGAAYTGTLTGVVTTSSSAQTGTVNFTVPYGVNSVTISARTISPLAENGSLTLVKGLTDTLLVTSECGVVRTYAVTLTPEVVSEEGELLSFGFHADMNDTWGFDWDEEDYSIEPGDAGWNVADRTITLTVPYVTDLHHLVAFFTSTEYSCVAIANTTGNVPQTSDVTINDHSNTLTYVVTAEDGTQERYEVTIVKEAVSSTKSFTDFALTNLEYCDGLMLQYSSNGHPDMILNAYTVDGDLVTINGNNISISVKNGTDVSDLDFAFELDTHLCTVAISGAGNTISKSMFDTMVTGNADFTSPVTITVTAQDFSQTVYTVTVVPRAANSDKVLTNFWFKKSTLNPIGNMDAVGVIDQTTRVVTVHVPFGSDVSNLAAGFILNNGVNDFPGGAVLTHSEDRQYVQMSDVTRNDYRHQVAFTVFAEDCTTLEYFVNVIVDANAGTDILSMMLTGFENAGCAYAPVAITKMGVITGNAIVVTVPFGTDLTALHLTPSLSPGATINPTLAANISYTGPITLTVTAANGVSTQVYTLTVVKEAALTGNELLTFGFLKDKNAAAGLTEDRWTVTPINNTTFRVDVKVPFGTDLTKLVASFTASPMSCVYTNGIYWTAVDLQTSGVTMNEYTEALTYTVKAQNGDEAYYNVYVTKDAALSEKVLSTFMLTGIGYCPDLHVTPATYNVAGTGTTAIAVSVKAGLAVSAVNYSFTVSPTATVTASNGTLTQVGGLVTGSANFGSAVTFTVKAQDGTTQVYTVTVTKRAADNVKQLTKYWLKGAPVNAIGGLDVVGTINETAKTVDVWVPWGTNLTHLTPSFELNGMASTYPGGVAMTHSEDDQQIQVSGQSWLDFTDPVAYTVIAEDCSTVEYFVTIRMTPNTDTGISGFSFTYTDCGCDLGTTIDAYARRIYITVPSTVNIASLAPTSIVVTPAIGTKAAASVSPKVDVAQNWTNGPVKYTVTAPDGVTKADWMVYVTNPKCKDTDILTFSLPNAQVTAADIVPGFGKPVTIDLVNHKIDVFIKKGIDLKSVYYERTLPCGATICCVGGNCQDNHYLDFSQEGCHTCVVTAQDQTVTQEWTICVHELDVAIPTVQTWSVMAYNCTDSVAVQSNELGRVFIVNENAINMTVDPLGCKPLYDLFDWTGTGAKSVSKLVANRMGAWATVTAVDTPVFVKTNGLYSGMYWAFSVDMSGKVSCISKEKLFLDICDVTVATLCDLRSQPDVWRYTLTEEVLVSYEETRANGNWKFVQNADCGILIEDRVAALPGTYGIGAGLTGLKGMLDKSGVAMKFIPVCCYTPTNSSTGNVVPVKELTWSQYASQCYTGNSYESMLVKVTTPMITFDDYHGHPNWMYDNLDLATTNAMGGYEWFIQSVFNSSLIGKVIPTVPAFYQGVRTNVNWGSVYGLFTPRMESDITLVTGTIITANPNPASIPGILPGNCGSTTIKIYNEGVGDATITALYLDDASATDEFQIVPTGTVTVPFTVSGWTYKTVEVKFCPLNVGDETTNLIVEYGVGKTLVVPINGSTAVINDLPSCQSFNSPFPGGSDFGASYMGWVSPPSNSVDLQNYVSTAWANFDGSPVMHMRPRQSIGGVRQTTYLITPGIKVTGSDPVITWVEATLTNAWAGPLVSPRNLYISTDGSTWSLVDSYTSADMPNAFTGGGFRTQIYSLAAYTGQTIWWKFELKSNNTASGWEYSYWSLDNICFQERVTAPIFVVAPTTGDFGGVQVGATSSLTFAVKNAGISVLKIKKVELTGAGFTLTDTNTYPFEVTDGPGTWAYTVGAAGSVLNFTVNFTPTDVGVYTGKVVVTYGLYSDMTYEIPLTGEGLSCATATEVNSGENFAPGHNSWWKYTADRFQITTITSCDPRNTVVPFAYAFDTFLRVYSDCDGTLIGENDDMEAACPTNRANSTLTVVMNEGESIYIFWDGIFINECETCDDPFYWHINPSYPIDGDVCETAIALTLPVVNHFGTTVGFTDDYNISPCSPFSNYMDGNDKVYSITLPYEGYLTASLLGAYGSIHVLDACPKEELEKFHCKAYTGGPNGGQFEKKIAAGTYYVIISTWAPPQTVDYLLNMSFRGTGVDDNALNNTMNVYPNPTNGKFTVSISNAEATDMTLELVNISGQVVYRNQVKAAYSYNEDIDATTFAKGVYYLKVNSAKGVKVEKVVVQ